MPTWVTACDRKFTIFKEKIHNAQNNEQKIRYIKLRKKQRK